MDLRFAPLVPPPNVSADENTLDFVLRATLPAPRVVVSDENVVTIPFAAIFKGEKGDDGPQGIQGERGPVGPALTPFEFEQSSPASTWAVVHNLGRRPSVTTRGADGGTFVGAVTYLDANSLTVDFTAPVAGFAELN